MKIERSNSNKVSGMLRIVAGLYLFNALSTTVMYMKTLTASSSFAIDLIKLRAYTIADIPFSIIPGYVVIFGLVRRRFWGWILALMLNAVYLHSMTVLFVENIMRVDTGSGLSDPMTPVSIYFLVFAVFSTMYLIRVRNRFR